MRKFCALIAVVLLCSPMAAAFAKGGPSMLKTNAVKDVGDELLTDIPVRVAAGARADTFSLGFYNPTTGYAILGEKWTWDHGAADPYEGWTSVDLTQATTANFRHITATSWNGHGNEVAAPVITGAGSAWVGTFEDAADALCWESGLGYGNSWCQKITSPIMAYTGSGDLTLSFKYFNDSEGQFDYTRVFVKKGSVSIALNESAPGNNDGFTDRINISAAGVLQIPATPWTASATQSQLGEAGNFTIQISFESDSGWSDEDGQYPTAAGPFGFDDVTVQPGTGGTPVPYNFDAGLQGWTPAACPGYGSYFDIHPITTYNLIAPCGCPAGGNVIGFHDANLQHPERMWEMAESNIVDRRAYLTTSTILLDYDIYYNMPSNDKVYTRIGYNYYPYTCPATGTTGWSGRKGDEYIHAYLGPNCNRSRNDATSFGIPSSAEFIRIDIEVVNICGNPGEDCSHVSNFSPIYDNVELRFTGNAQAPVIASPPGMTYQDGFPQAMALETNGVGNASASLDINMDNDIRPDKLGDSIAVNGPSVPTSGAGRWEAREYVRVTREGPAQRSIPRYNTWYEKVRDGRNITGPNAPFTFAWMDSAEIAGNPQRHYWCSYFREIVEDDFTPGAPGPGYDRGEDNEIVWDNMLTPGTKIEYFISSNYICTPNEQFVLPDTAGKNFNEFEILPSYRMSGGVAKFPCILYIDAFNGGSQFYIENALNVVLNGALPGQAIPDPTSWDRYDFANASSNTCGPLFRRNLTPTNAGASMPQLLGYRLMLVSTGNQVVAMTPADWTGYGDWLQYIDCSANASLQGYVLNGNGSGKCMTADLTGAGTTFMTDYLGANFICDKYNEPTCPTTDPDNDQNECVRLTAAAGGPFPMTLESDVYGNWCPVPGSFDVVGTNGGAGNKVYTKVGTGTNTEFAQVTNDRRAPGNANNYRTVLDGFSYHNMAKRAGNSPTAECPSDSASIVEASYSEIRSALRWALNITNPSTLGLCIDPCFEGPVDVPDQGGAGLVNMLYQNNPNPFNPRTVIKFSLAKDGLAKLLIYDVNGRQVKTLVNSRWTAGPHEVVWDGTDDAGHTLGSGVYWSRLTTGDYSSNRKMVVLK